MFEHLDHIRLTLYETYALPTEPRKQLSEFVEFGKILKYIFKSFYWFSVESHEYWPVIITTDFYKSKSSRISLPEKI